MVILNHREALFYDIVTICLDQIQLLSNAFVVTVTTVAGLDPVQEQKLIPIIEKKIWDSSSLDPTKIDPDLIGGFVVTANHKTLDTSLKHQLQVIKSKLK